jgi:hypothetical protein
LAVPFLEEPRLSPREKEDLLRGAGHQATYSYIRNTILIRGNTPGPLENFDSMHGRFKVPFDARLEPDITLVYREEEGEERDVTYLVNGSPYRVRHREMMETIFATMIFLVMKHMRSHYIVHAGCLSVEGRGVIISGRSGMGKSTLTAHLATRGMGFLSDELAPISRRTGMIDAVPMPIGIRPGPARALVTDKPTFDYSFRGDEKKLIDIEALSGEKPVEAVPPAHVVFLTDSRDSRVATPKKFDSLVRVMTTADEEGFDRALTDLEGVTLKNKNTAGEFPSFLLEVEDGEAFLPDLYRILEEWDLELVGLAYEDLDPPDFTATPRLTPIPPAAGVIELVKKIPSFNIKEMARSEFEGKLTPLIAELSSLLKEVRFYKLSPGRIDAMIECMEGLSR